MRTRFLFVGERPSPRAAEIDATWFNGRLCAKTLRGALEANGIDIRETDYKNLWQSPGLGPGETTEANDAAGAIREIAVAEDCVVVALGQIVSRVLTANKVPHLKMVHPAARGKIRGTALYRQHVGEVLTGSSEPVRIETGKGVAK